MTEPPILYELASEPAVPDLTIAAAAIACRASYTAVNRAVVDYMNGERVPYGTPDHTAVMCWRAVTEYVRIAGGASHSTREEAAIDVSLSNKSVDQRVPDLTGPYVSE